jgi:hypothetical protein
MRFCELLGRKTMDNVDRLGPPSKTLILQWLDDDCTRSGLTALRSMGVGRVLHQRYNGERLKATLQNRLKRRDSERTP